MKKVRMLLSFILFVFAAIVVSPSGAAALQPTLLWEKTLPFKIGGIKMAYQSGDVIVVSGDARQIILFGKDGNERFHWGPRIDRQPMGIDISDDGSVILYMTSWTDDHTEKNKIDTVEYGWDTRVHYSTRKGKELWNKKIYGAASLSPDGKMVAVFKVAGEGKDLTILDSQGNVLWKYVSRDEFEAPVFSPDSNYILYNGVYGTSIGGGLHLFDKAGNLLWKKDGAGAIGSISDGAAYVATTGYNEKVYDKQGNVVLDGEAYVSGDGKRLLVVYPDKVSILNLPDKTVIGEYSGGGFLSHDGRFLSGTSPSGNRLIVDTINHTSDEIPTNIRRLESTKDGRYLLFVIENKLLFYQIY